MKFKNRSVLTFAWAAVLTLLTSSTTPAPAQCTPEWQSMGIFPGTDDQIYDVTTWDPDGAGPLPAQLVAGGRFMKAGGVAASRIARWDGAAWQTLGTGTYGDVYALTTWDPDGAGPLPAQLVAGGNFATAGGVTVNGITRWDGAAWQPFGTGLGGTPPNVYSLTTWDPDGEGPLPAQLVAGGEFATAGGVTANRIARWDGAAWQPFGTGIGNAVTSLTTWDPDGAGPLPAQLVAGGRFTSAGGVIANHIARWDGVAWQHFGTGINDEVSSLTTWDPDGAGPQSEQLVAGGYFTTAGGVTVNRIARWDGVAWQPFGTGMGGTTSPYVYSLTTWDPDGAGPLPAQLVAGGSFATAGGVAASRIARWDGAVWRPFGTGLGGANPNVYSLTTWDPDGAGPLSAQPVAGGWFSSAGDNISRWDGATWQSLGMGMNGVVSSFATWDPDGAGPLPAQQVAAGSFTRVGGVAVNSIARWDGTAWQPFGTGIGGTSPYVSSLSTWDPDGAGPLPAQLVAGGEFTTAGGVTANRIARWNGSTWQSFGAGMGGGMYPYVYALTTWDPDGEGPLPAQLVAGGNFTTAGGVTVNGLARWDGVAWQPFGTGMNNSVNALTTWDPDGEGPLPAQLVAGGEFATAGGVTVNRIARWDGVAWQPFGTGAGGTSSYVFSFTTWDPDGAGPLPVQLVAGGDFTTVGGAMVNRIARWDGVEWQPFGTGVDGRVYSFATFDPDGAGPLPARLVVGGTFATVGGLVSPGIALFGCPASPTCPADLDDGTGAGVPDQAVNIDDLLFFLVQFEAGDIHADLDDGSGTGTRDDAVTIDDLLFFLAHFEAGC